MQGGNCLPESLRDLPKISGHLSSEQFLQFWSKYEDIAIHFNDLIIKLRTQALGVVVAVISLTAGFKSSGGSPNWLLLGCVGLFVLLCWAALFVLDYCYYTNLLKGAVHAIRQLEHHHPHIKMSTVVEQRTPNNRKAIKWFYAIVTFALAMFISVCFYGAFFF